MPADNHETFGSLRAGEGFTDLPSALDLGSEWRIATESGVNDIVCRPASYVPAAGMCIRPNDVTETGGASISAFLINTAPANDPDVCGITLHVRGNTLPNRTSGTPSRWGVVHRCDLELQTYYASEVERIPTDPAGMLRFYHRRYDSGVVTSEQQYHSVTIGENEVMEFHVQLRVATAGSALDTLSRVFYSWTDVSGIFVSSILHELSGTFINQFPNPNRIGLKIETSSVEGSAEIVQFFGNGVTFGVEVVPDFIDGTLIISDLLQQNGLNIRMGM